MFNVDFTGYEGDIYLTGLMMKKWVISWDMRYLTQLKKEYHIFNRYVFFSDLQNPEKGRFTKPCLHIRKTVVFVLNPFRLV